MAYILDSNIFIQAKNLTYPFNTFDGFWDWISSEIKIENIILCRPVYNELKDQRDDLAKWITGFSNLVKEPKGSVKAEYHLFLKNISNYVYNQYPSSYKVFFDGADPYIIAFALASHNTIVTHEKNQPECQRPKIPVISSHFGAQTISLLDLFKALHPKFSYSRT